MIAAEYRKSKFFEREWGKTVDISKIRRASVRRLKKIAGNNQFLKLIQSPFSLKI